MSLIFKAHSEKQVSRLKCFTFYLLGRKNDQRLFKLSTDVRLYFFSLVVKYTVSMGQK